MSERSLGNVRRTFAPWNDPAARPLVEFRGVTKRFGPVLAVDDLTLTIYPREFFALIGPSGCGKTTLMRMLAGFETPDSGDLRLDGASLAGVPPHRRPVNMMFQSYALFPHMSVWDNIAFGLRQEGLARAECARRVEEVLGLVRLTELARRRPDQLSGGQRQRVALARALVKRPRVLLLDEPLGALDRKLREATQYELMDLQHELGLTFLMVTHDQEEAMVMADRIAVMNRGCIAQCAVPGAIYETPVSRYVAEFVGDINIIEAEVLAAGAGRAVLASRFFGTVHAEFATLPAPGTRITLAIRPEKIALTAQEPPDGANKVAGAVWDIGYLGNITIVKVKIAAPDGPLVKVSIPNGARRAERPIAWEDRVWLSWDADAAILLQD